MEYKAEHSGSIHRRKKLKQSGKEKKMENKLKDGRGTEKYLSPEFEVIEFETEDVIITSPGGCGVNIVNCPILGCSSDGIGTCTTVTAS